MATGATKETMILEVLAGPPMANPAVPADKPTVLGRTSQADVRLLDETVSRRHAQIFVRAETWYVTDLESRHGTTLNGIAITANNPAPMQEGDLLRIGPWTFRVRFGAAGPATALLSTSDDAGDVASRVQRVPAHELNLRAQHRLELLIDCSANIASAPTEQALANAALDAVIAGTLYPRAAFIRHVGSSDGVELVAYKGPDAVDPSRKGGMPNLALSRSLLRAASEGQVVRMDSGSSANYGQSIIDLGIHSAICAPVMIGANPAAYLYLDARGGETQVQPDAAAFCQAISRICGLALSNLNRATLEARQKALENDLKAARDAQSLIMPPPGGQIGRITYAMHSEPGRIVAGDLFDVVALEDGRVAVFLGDVAGKGVGAALLMATVQAHLNASLRTNSNPGKAMDVVNRHIAHHCADGRFITLWLGVFDPARNMLDYVDAGHGYWLLRRPGGAPGKVPSAGGLPLGIDAETTYEPESVSLTPGTRLIVFSDGVVEQQSPQGEEFGVAKTIETLTPGENPDQDVSALVRAVKAHAAPHLIDAQPRPFEQAPVIALADDVTVASVQVS
ncbi:MAG: SpoIIE family protein phosphatase [Planctomycetota bacterium]|nr:SpoIIE family protein phosphatase [Planctomycetota bacterium]